jgi:hypothetical protein
MGSDDSVAATLVGKEEQQDLGWTSRSGLGRNGPGAAGGGMGSSASGDGGELSGV